MLPHGQLEASAGKRLDHLQVVVVAGVAHARCIPCSVLQREDVAGHLLDHGGPLDVHDRQGVVEDAGLLGIDGPCGILTDAPDDQRLEGGVALDAGLEMRIAVRESSRGGEDDGLAIEQLAAALHHVRIPLLKNILALAAPRIDFVSLRKPHLGDRRSDVDDSPCNSAHVSFPDFKWILSLWLRTGVAAAASNPRHRSDETPRLQALLFEYLLEPLLRYCGRGGTKQKTTDEPEQHLKPRSAWPRSPDGRVS